MAVDLQLQPLLDQANAAGPPDFGRLTPTDMRVGINGMLTMFNAGRPPVEGVAVRDLSLRTAPPLPARLYRPALPDGPSAAIVFFHGGGWVVGDLETHDVFCRHFAGLVGCTIISVDYRLAPEHKFPTATNDAWDALHWLAKQAGALGLDGSRIAVGGDSAGGTLAAVCAIKARDASLPLALQLLFYPGCAAHQDTPSHTTFAEGFVIEETHITYFFNHYINTPADRDDWRFAPLLAPDVDGVAPAWIGLAECDPLVDEGLMYADKLRAAGVAVDLEIYRGMVHEFIKMGRAIPQALQAHADAARALKHAFGTP